MICPNCKAETEANNQHSTCTQCGKTVGTSEQRTNEDKLALVKGEYERWETGTYDARQRSERDRDYYDGNQWTAEEKAELERRGQAPVVKNRIQKKINFLLGTEIRGRSDPKALPRTPVHDDEGNAITDALRYVADVEDLDKVHSLGWENALIEGACGAVVEPEIVVRPRPIAIAQAPGMQATAGVIKEDVEIRIRYVTWDRLWHDIHSRKADFSDALYKGIVTWWDEQEAVDFYSNKAGVSDNFRDVISATTANNEDTNRTHEDRPRVAWTQVENGRKRVKITEAWYQEAGEWYVCHFTQAGFIIPPRLTGYVDEDGRSVCNLTMSSGFVDREGYRYGIVRQMIGPQDEINKRSSKAMHWLSVDRVIAERDSILDPDEAQTERAKPDGWVWTERDALKESRVIFEKGLDMAQGQISLLEQAKGEIDSIGPEIPQMTTGGANASGRAQMVRMQIGGLELAKLEDNHRRWKRSIYRLIWLMIRQYWKEEKWLRVRDDAQQTGFRFVALNRQMTRGQRFMELLQNRTPIESATLAVMQPQEAQIVLSEAQQAQEAELSQLDQEAQQEIPPQIVEQNLIGLVANHPLMQQPMVMGDVARLGVDIVLDEAPDATILQQEEYEQLAQHIPTFLQAQPQMAGTLLEMLIEASQLRNKKRLLEMMRKPPDPQAVQMQQAAQQLELAKTQSEVQKNESQAGLNQAKMQSELAELQLKPDKAQAEVMAKTAGAMHDAAIAGARAGGDL